MTEPSLKDRLETEWRRGEIADAIEEPIEEIKKLIEEQRPILDTVTMEKYLRSIRMWLRVILVVLVLILLSHVPR